jgi:hypothetical protein
VPRVVQAVREPVEVRRRHERLLRFRGPQIAAPRRMKYFIAWLLGVPGGIIVLWFLANQIGC